MKFREYLNEAKISKQDKKVLDWLKAKEKVNKNKPFNIYGVNTKDIIKMIEKPSETNRWDNDFFNKVEKAVDKIYNTIK